MAYELLYYNEFTSFQFKKLVRIEILKLDHSPASFTKEIIGAVLKIGDAGDERHIPIKKTTCELSLVSKTDQQFSQFFTSNDKEFQVKIFRGGVLIWSGFIEADSYGEPYSFDRNYNIGVTARDNLGTLEDIKYLDDLGDRYAGLEKASIILSRCLGKTGLDLVLDDQINIFSDTMSESLTTTEQEYINQTGFVNDDGETYSCLEVLESILLGHGAQIRQSNGKWVIREIGTYFNTPQETKGVTSQPLLVNVSGDVLLVNDIDYLDIGGDGYRWLNKDSDLVFKEAWKQFTVEQDFKVSANIFEGFPKNDDDFNFEGPLQGDYSLVGWTMNTPFVKHQDGINQFWIDMPSDTIDGYVGNNSLVVEASTDSFKIILDTRVFYNFNPTGSIDIDIDIDIISNNSKILTPSGWVNYIAQERQLEFSNVRSSSDFSELTIFLDSIPESGPLEIRLWNSQTAFIYRLQFSDIRVVAVGASSNIPLVTGQNITASVDQDNNLTPDNIELEIGQVDNATNADLYYMGGLFDSSGVVLEDWHRKCCPTSVYPLLEVVTRGYNTQYKQSAWQISGSILWDFDLFTSMNESGHVLLVNDLSWNLNNDQASGEFIEVFEYDDTIDIIEESQITDGSTRDFFQVNDNVDFLAFTIDAGAPKRITDLADEADPTNSYIILDDSSKTESKRFSWGAFITALENTLNSFLRKDQNLADLNNVSTAQTNLDVYGKSASDARYVNIDGDETINDTKTFSELIGLVKGWFIGIFTSGFAGQGARLNLNGGKTELEVDRLKVREVFTAYETQIGQIRGIDGDLIVSSSEKAEAVIEEELNILVEDGVELLVDDLINLEI